MAQKANRLVCFWKALPFFGWLLLLLTCPGKVLRSQSIERTLPLGDYTIEVSMWSKKDGLPSWVIQTLHQTNDDRLWLHHFGQLSSFDGENFTTYPITELGSALDDGRIGTFFPDAFDNLWLVGKKNNKRHLEVFLTAAGKIVDVQEYTGIDFFAKIEEDFSHLIATQNQYLQLIVDQKSKKGLYFDEKWTELPFEIQGLEDVKFLYRYNGSKFWVINQINSISLVDIATGERVDFPNVKNTSAPYTLTKDGSLLCNTVELPKGSHIIQLHATGVIDTFPWMDGGIDNFKTHQIAYSKGHFPVLNSSLIRVQVIQGKIKIFNKQSLICEDLEGLLYDQLKIYLDGGATIYLLRDGSFLFQSSYGLVRVNIQKNQFKALLFRTGGHSVRGIAKTRDGNITVCSYDGAILEIDRTTGSVMRTTLRDIPFVSLETEKGQWVGSSFEGLDFIDRHTNEIKRYPIKQGFSTEINTSFIQLTNTDTILLGTMQGLWILDKESEVIRPHQYDNLGFHYLHQSNQGEVWYGTNNGLLHGPTNTFYLPEINNKKLAIYHIAEIHDDDWWLSTNQGLVFWHPFSDTFEQYTVENGLSDNRLHASYPDQHGNLWISSNSGLMRFNIATKAVKTFYREDGLLHEEFNYLSHYQDDNGQLYFGGLNGVLSFHPDSLEIKANDLTSLQLQLKQVDIFDRKTNAPSSQFLPARREGVIDISTQFNRVQVEVNAPYYGPNSIQYQWRIIEQDTSWKTLTSNLLELNQFVYGKYQLQFRASVAGSTYYSNQINLTLHWHTPIYLRWWFLALLALLFMGLVVFIIRWYNYRLRVQNQELEKLIKQRTQSLLEQNETIKHQAEELQKLDRAKNRFFMDVSHEFRTSLSLILAPVGFLLRKYVFDDDVKKQLKRVQGGVRHLQELTEEILDLSRLESGQIEAVYKTTKWSELKGRLETRFTPLADQKAQSFNWVDQPSIYDECVLDGQKVERIIGNLISNAIKYSPRQSEIIVQSQLDEAQLRVKVIDAGPGISRYELPHLFDRFYRGKSAEQSSETGFGIGLAMSNEFAKLMKGTIDVSSKVGEGSTFLLALPTEIVETNAVVVTSNKPTNTTPSPTPHVSDNLQEKKASILLVEDNQDLLHFLEDVLSDQFNLRLASDGRQAWSILQEQNSAIDLVISDIMMPRMTGIELLIQARKQPSTAQVPFIMLSAVSDIAVQNEAFRLGLDYYLTKPFETNELLTRITNIIGLKPKHKKNTVTSDGLSIVHHEQAWLKDLESIVQQKMRKPGLKISEIADALFVSERTLRNQLKEHTGFTPAQYLMKSRLHLAFYYLENKQYNTLSEVAYAIGFKDPAHFSRAFKQEYGKSPSFYLN